MKFPAKLKSRKFWITVVSNILAGYLASQGHVEAATIVAGVATGSYNVGQGMEDAAKAKASGAVAEVIEGMMHGD